MTLAPLDLLCDARNLLTASTPGSPRTMFDSDVISFAHGDGLRRPPADILALAGADTRAAGRHSIARYQSHEPYLPLLRELLVAQRRWYGTGFADCAFGPGVTGLFQAIVRAFALDRRPVAVSQGYYHASVGWAAAAKMTFCVAERDPQGQICPDRLAQCLKSTDAPLVLINNPNYLGQLMDSGRAEAVARVIEASGAMLIEDGIFSRDIHVAAATSHVCGFLPPDYNCCIVDSGSKSFGLANARAGWVLGSRPLVSRVQDYLDAVGPSYSYVSQALLHRMIEAPDDYLQVNRGELARRRGLLHDLVAEVNQTVGETILSIPFQDGGSHSTLLRLDLRKGMDDDPFAVSRYLLDVHGLACPPGIAHGLTASDIRLNYGCVGSEANMDMPLDSVDEFAAGRAILEQGLARLKTGLLAFAAGRRA